MLARIAKPSGGTGAGRSAKADGNVGSLMKAKPITPGRRMQIGWDRSAGAIAQAGPEVDGHQDLIGTELSGEVGARYLRMGDAGAFE